MVAEDFQEWSWPIENHHRPGQENVDDDALSCNPAADNPSGMNLDEFMLQISTQEKSISKNIASLGSFLCS